MIDQHYPRASRHLQNARQAKTGMGSLWATLLDDDLVQDSVTTQTDGMGTISAFLAWPPGQQSELTNLFRSCVRELWACLDELIMETVESLSVLRRIHRPKRPRFFPIADSKEGFEALLAESCMDGTLRTHVAMVEDCQPFQDSNDHKMVVRFREGLKFLLEWDTALEAGALVGAWATPVDPQVRAQPPAVIEHIQVENPGALDDEERVLARYQLRSYSSDCSVSAQAGTYVDLCFTQGFTPTNAQDTFEQRLRLVIDVVTRFAVSFAWLSSRAPGSRRVLASGTETEDDARVWIEAARSARGWSKQDLAALADSDLGLGRVRDAETLTLLVHTADGVFERVIPRATPLRAHDRRGTAAEIAVRDAAATWGLPDFVMAPSVERKGPGVREISDGLLVVGRHGIVVQIKAREGEPGTPERETNWVLKQITEASKQVDGTVRRLKAEATQMFNGRGRTVRIDGPAIDWVGVVIVEHPDPPQQLATPDHTGRTPVVAILRRDWEFLFNQLRSTYAVAQYLHRVGASTRILGTEPERYYELAAADAAALPGPFDPSWIRRGAKVFSMPLLPAAPAGSDDDQAHTMVRVMLEDIATSSTGPDEPEAWQWILASLDSLPVGYRTELGRFLLSALSAITRAKPDTISWRMRSFIGGTELGHLGFAVCNALTETTYTAFMAWLRLRHHERNTSGDANALPSIGVLLTPCSDGPREWDTTVLLIDDDPELTDEELQAYRALWNTSDGSSNSTTA